MALFFGRRNDDRTLLERVRRRPKTRKWLWIAVFGVLFSSLFILLFVTYTFWFYADGLIARDRLVNRQFRGLIMHDKDGQVIYESGVQYRSGDVAIGDVPLILRQATVAVEDKDFYRHTGFSIPAMVRAFFANQAEGEIVQGASTITQQLVKNALLGDTSTRYVRKVREVILAFAIEYRYSKDELLELYLNSIYYGRGAWGVGEAAKQYFGKEASELTEAEATFLAGMPQAPSVYGSNMESAKARQRMVLSAMIEQSLLDATKANQLMNTPLPLAEYRPFSVKYPFFTLQVREQLLEMLGLDGKIQDSNASRSNENIFDPVEELINRGLVVYTTFDQRAQDLAEDAVMVGVDELRGRNVTNGAAMVMDTVSGAVRAMVGSVDWFDDAGSGKVNVLYTQQQPGSTLKPLIYAAALNEGAINSSTIFQDVRKDFGGGYVPVNYDGRYRGAVNLRRALANSLNVPAVEALNRVGIDNAVNYLVKMGILSLERNTQYTNNNTQINSNHQNSNNQTIVPYSQYYGLSLALGGYEVMPVEVVGAFGVLGRSGVYKEPYLIEKVVDRFGSVIYQHQDPGVQVVEARHAQLITDILADNNARRETFGTRSSNLEIASRAVSVKTGTTTDYRDSWAVGYDSRFVVGVWVGNNNNSAMQEVAGSVGGAGVWKRIFEGL